MSQVLWVTSYPKSGNTWMRFMLTCYLTGSAVSTVESVQSFVPDFAELIVRGEVLPAERRDPILMKTQFLPKAGTLQLHRTETRKAIYMVRNPRDILLTQIRHLGLGNEENPEPARRLAEGFIANHGWSFMRYDGGAGSWPEHVESWSDPDTVRQYFPAIDVHVVRYEDVKADPIGQLRDIIEFLDLGQPIVPDDVRKAAENSSLEKMREVEEKSPPPMPGISPFGSRGKFIGQGNSNQSLAPIGDDIEESYQRLVEDDGAFSRCAKRFGYDKVDR